MASKENEEVFRRFYGGAWNAGDPGVIDELLDEGFVNHELAGSAGSHRETHREA